MNSFRAAVKKEMDGATSAPVPTPEPAAAEYYRVRKTWADSKTQKGAYKVLSNAKKCADDNPGYLVFDSNGQLVYAGKNTPAHPSTVAYKVKVTADSLNIRKGPGTNTVIAGAIKDKGVYTIVDEGNGPGATKWGKLKSGAGWISLDYCQKR